MDSIQINNILNKYLKHKCHHGVYPSDMIPEFNKRPVGLIINTLKYEERNEMGHWICLILHKNGKGELFDPLAQQLKNKYLIEYLNKNCEKGWIYNTTKIQSNTSIKCGLFCILYLTFRCSGLSRKKIFNFFNKKNLELNDVILTKLYKKIPKIK